MSNNLHISYDLNQPGQNYERVITCIKSLGAWARVHKSFWYVNSNLSAEQACRAIRNVMDNNDQLYVVDATNNQAAWHNLPDEQAQFIRGQWNTRVAA